MLLPALPPAVSRGPACLGREREHLWNSGFQALEMLSSTLWDRWGCHSPGWRCEAPQVRRRWIGVHR